MSENGSARHEVVIIQEAWYFATCICGWRGQNWETEVGAKRDYEFHEQHPALTGEHPAIEENGQ